MLPEQASTVQALARELEGAGRMGKAMAALESLERQLNEALLGLPFTPQLLADAVNMASQAMPLAAGRRWVAVQDGTRIVMHAELDGEIPRGYRFAARVTTGFDGGRHPQKGDLWACRRCGSAILPESYQDHDRHHAEADGRSSPAVVG